MPLTLSSLDAIDLILSDGMTDDGGVTLLSIRNSEAKSKEKEACAREMEATSIVALNKVQQAKVNAEQHLVEADIQRKKEDNKMQLMCNNLEVMKMRKQAKEFDSKLTLENLNEMFPLHKLS